MKEIVGSIFLAWVILGSSFCSTLASPAPISSDEVLVGDFSKVMGVAGLEKPVRSHGTFVVWPNQGIIWHSVHPFDVIYVMTEDGIFEGNEEGTLMPLAESSSEAKEVGSCLKALMTGDEIEADSFWEVVQDTRKKEPGWTLEVLARNQTLRQILPRIVATGHEWVESIKLYASSSMPQKGNKKDPRKDPFSEITLSNTRLEKTASLPTVVKGYFKG